MHKRVFRIRISSPKIVNKYAIAIQGRGFIQIPISAFLSYVCNQSIIFLTIGLYFSN